MRLIRFISILILFALFTPFVQADESCTGRASSLNLSGRCATSTSSYSLTTYTCQGKSEQFNLGQSSCLSLNEISNAVLSTCQQICSSPTPISTTTPIPSPTRSYSSTPRATPKLTPSPTPTARPTFKPTPSFIPAAVTYTPGSNQFFCRASCYIMRWGRNSRTMCLDGCTGNSRGLVR